MAEKTEAQKRAQKNYMEKFSVARVRMNKSDYEFMQAHAAAHGESVNGFIGRAIKETVARDGAETPADTPERDSGVPILLPRENASQAVSAQVKAHIMKTGEDAVAFLERATESTIKRDEISLRMGINPATRAKEDLPNE